MPSQACQSEMLVDHAARQLYAMAGSSSMPSFAFTADVYETLTDDLPERHLHEHEHDESGWLRKSKTQCFNEDRSPGRRILPRRPDEVRSARSRFLVDFVILSRN